ncbi:penicillin-binding protein 2 [Alphaproteobacteria bacterium]|nr:penicillin-binding protein 2 [Alphaproteobacteria bacterium]
MLNNYDPKKEIQRRIIIIISAILMLVGLLIYELYFLQVDCYNKYAMLSEKNRVRLSPLLPKRGRIFTADGKLIASSKYKYKLTIESCAENIFLKNLELLETCIDLSAEEKEALLEMRRKVPRYSPIIIRDGLSWDEYAKLSIIFYKLSHVSIDDVYVREYDMPFEFSHVVGYASKSENNLQILNGKTGIELSMNADLIGEIGNLKTEINAAGRKIRKLESVDPISGKDVTLTINSEIQKYVFDLISAEKAGACVVLDLTDGSVVALVSAPGFDTNLISSKISRTQWNAIIKDPLSPLTNRAITGKYPPGSVFKIVVAFAALSEGIITPKDTFFCSGAVTQDNATFHCWNRQGHGRVNVCDAIRGSCDCFFFEISKKLGIDKIAEYAEKFGFGKLTEIELPNESSGLLPNKKWKLLKYRKSWKPYETIITSIGQGALQATLLQVATMFGKLYTNNYDFTPTIINQRDQRDVGSVFCPSETYARGNFNVEAVSVLENACGATTQRDVGPNNDQHDNCGKDQLCSGLAHSSVIKDALHQVCNSWSGTAFRSCKADYEISGKTGSSQVRRIKRNEAGVSQKNFQWHLRDHAFFVGVAPQKNKNPRYVVAVLIEHGGGGASTAAPIARKIFDKLILTEENEKR